MSSLVQEQYKLPNYSPELASVYLLERAYSDSDYDLVEQVKDEEATRFAEIIDGPIWTEFNFKLTDEGLVSKGGLRLLDLWKNSYDLTAIKAQSDSRLGPILQFRETEYKEGIEVENLAKYGNDGDGFLVISAYPEEIEKIYGKDFVNKEGFNSSRKLAFVRQYQKMGNTVVLTTASVDNSDLSIWSELIGQNINNSNELLTKQFSISGITISSLIDRYDALMQTKKGSLYKQGRLGTASHETYIFVKNQQDLLEYNLSSLKEIAQSYYSEEEKLNQKVNLTKSVASALRYRYENKPFAFAVNIQSELASASQKARKDGMEYISCGGYLSSDEAGLLNTITRSTSSLKCVTCPFCKKTVDAVVKTNYISCPKCLVQVNTKTNKIIDKKMPKISFTKIIEQILDDLFSS